MSVLSKVQIQRHWSTCSKCLSLRGLPNLYGNVFVISVNVMRSITSFSLDLKLLVRLYNGKAPINNTILLS